MIKAPQTQLQHFKVLTFDCYGTLIDWESGILLAFQRDLGFSSELAQQALEKFGELETQHQKMKPKTLYPKILEDVVKDIGSHFGRVCALLPFESCLLFGLINFLFICRFSLTLSLLSL
jgi:hypothetical protein